MKRLYDNLEIERWIEIAKGVHDLDLKRENWDNNVKILKSAFKNAELYGNKGKNIPQQKRDIGIYTLLQGIYNTPFGKTAFINSIAALNALGIKNIKYCPMHLTTVAYTDAIYHPESNKIVKKKIYTDGLFKLTRNLFGGHTKEEIRNMSGIYTLDEIQNANFLLTTEIEIKTLKDVQLKDASIEVKKFNIDYDLPHRDELLSIEYPDLIYDKEQHVKWGETPFVRQTYQKMDYSDKKFIKTYNSIIKG